VKYHHVIHSLKKTPVLPEFHYWIAAWIAFGQIPQDLFLQACFENDYEKVLNNPHYTTRNYQDIKDWLNREAPPESFGSECLKWYPVKMQREAEEKLRLFAEHQHRN
jgi:hypothetical protein